MQDEALQHLIALEYTAQADENHRNHAQYMKKASSHSALVKGVVRFEAQSLFPGRGSLELS